jgi:hypothetical protein
MNEYEERAWQELEAKQLRKTLTKGDEMTKDDLIRYADMVGYDVDEDEVHAPAAGRYGIDPRLVQFAQLVANATTMRQKARYYQDGYEAGQRDEREACAKICEEFVLGDPHAAAIRERNEK